LPNSFGAKAGTADHSANARLIQLAKQMMEERSTCNRDDCFRDISRRRAQSGAKSASENNGG